jgi:mannose-6-phosphate isomerase-like protein (cupin superfamily)
MNKVRDAIILASLLAALPAQAEVTFKHISGEEAARAVAGPTMPGNIADGPQFSMSLHKRTGPSHVEKHMGWDEELVIQQGTVLLNTGDTASKPHENSPGEFNGDAITGGKSVMLHAGDIVILPAGLWHQQIPQGPLMRYILFKTRKTSG